MLTLSEVANRFQNARQQGAGFMARCPAHDDGKASLSISAGDDGKILLHCHAGCTFDAITKAANLKPSDLMPAREAATRRIVKTYPYQDEDGKLLYEAVRYEPKGFTQRTPDGNGGWVWKLNGVRRVLFRLPQIRGADPEQTVFIGEGEKDVERLEAHGVLVTTNAGGADNWLPEYSRELQGRNVVILEDNDDAGRKRTAKIGRSLEGIAATVRVLTLPGLPDKGDVSDWLNNGGTIRELLELGDAAPVWEPTEPGEQYTAANDGAEQPHGKEKPTDCITYRRYDIDTLLDGDFSTEFVIDGLLVAGQPLLIGGMQKTLKTNILLDAAISLASGSPMLGKFTVNRKCTVGVMTGESGMATVKETVARIMHDKGVSRDDVRGRLILSDELPHAADVRHHEALDKFIRQDGIEWLVIDPAYLSLPAEDNGNLFKQGALLRLLTTVCSDAGAALGLCHHTRPIPDFRPAELQDLAWSGFKEYARTWWMLNRRAKFDPNSDGEHHLWLTVGGSAGFNSLWAVDVVEGKVTNNGGRRWEVSVATATDAKGQEQEQRQQQREANREVKQTAKIERMKEAVATALRSVPGNADTKSAIRERCGCSGNNAAFNEAFAYLLRVGKLVECEVTRSNRKEPYEGYRYVFENPQ